MTQIILETIKPVVIEKLKNLAQKQQRTLEAEITAILEDVVESMPIVTSENRSKRSEYAVLNIPEYWMSIP